MKTSVTLRSRRPFSTSRLLSVACACVAVPAIFMPASTAFAEDLVWVGDIDGNWITTTRTGGVFSVPYTYYTNWSPDGGSSQNLPNSSDTVIFKATAYGTNVNLGGYRSVRNVRFDGGQSYSLAGGTIAVSDTISSTSWVDQYVDSEVVHFSSGGLDISATTSSSRIYLRNGLDSNSHLFKKGTGKLYIQGTGTTDNFVSGNLYVDGGTLYNFETLAVGDAAESGAASGYLTLSNTTNTGSGGRLYVRYGSTLEHNGNATLGDQGGEFGYASVAGSNSTWTNTGELMVGSYGIGTLDITAGGAVSNTTGYVGRFANSSGSATVNGAGSTWTNAGYLTIGRHAAATLDIENGGVVSSTNGYTGRESGSVAATTVTGDGSAWHNTGSQFVGHYGNGTLNVEGGGEVTSLNGFIGFGPTTGLGTATITGSDSSWGMSGELRVGHAGTGTLNVQDSGSVENADGYIGYSSSGTGTATVTGAGSTWTNTGDLYVGRDGAGSLTLGVAGNVNVGDAAAAGAAADWLTVSDGDNTNGSGAGGHLYVQNGSTLTNNQGSTLGDGANEHGYATVTGANTTWTNSSTLIVGNEGAGVLHVAAGAEVTNNLSGYLGKLSGSSGIATVTGTGSKWITSGDLFVGFEGNGTLNIEDDADVKIGDTAKNVSGSPSLFIRDLDNTDGAATGGRLFILNGSTLNNNAGSATIAALGGYGYATVGGAGSLWNNSSGALTLGTGTGSGTLLIEEGGAVTSLSSRIATSANAHGNATVTGVGSQWDIQNSLTIANRGAGTLTIESGGLVENLTGHIGLFSGSTGTVTVTGAGSTWTNTGSLFIGGSTTSAGGSGTLNILSGGLVDAQDLKIWADGSVNLNGGTLSVNQLLFDVPTPASFVHTLGTLEIRQQDTYINAGVTADLTAGKTLKIGQMTAVTTGGAINLHGGVLDTATLDLTAGGTFDFLSGTLVADAVLGTLNQYGGTLAPGNSPGTTEVSSDYNLNSGTLAIEIAGLTAGSEHDEVIISGTLNLGAGSVLYVTLIDGFTVSNGDTFDILDFSSVTGTFGTLNLATLNGGLQWDTSSLYTDGSLTVVPEPSSLAILAMAGLLVTRRRRSA